MTTPASRPDVHSPPARARRLGLYGPFIALAIALGAWSLVWVALAWGIESRLDGLAIREAAHGTTLAWSRRQVSGYPFRLDLEFDNLVWRNAAGSGLKLPELKTETTLLAFGHWVAFAPAGATILRGPKGPVTVSAQVLRASISALGAHPPSLSVEGAAMTFKPSAGAAPYWLTAADGLHLHSRAGPNDQGALFVELDKAMVDPSTPIGRLAGEAPLELTVDALFDHASALQGPTPASALANWRAAGGLAHPRAVSVQLGGLTLSADGGAVGIDSDGRLNGRLTHAGLPLLSFAGGRTRAAGAVDMAPAPKLY